MKRAAQHVLSRERQVHGAARLSASYVQARPAARGQRCPRARRPAFLLDGLRSAALSAALVAALVAALAGVLTSGVARAEGPLLVRIGHAGDTHASHVAMAGDVAYVSSQSWPDAVLLVYSLADPVRPRLLRQIAGVPYALHVVDELLLVADYNPAPFSQLLVYDIEIPDDPRLLGRIERDYGITSIAYRDGLAYLAGQGTAVDVVSLRDPTEPRSLGQLSYEPGELSWWEDGFRDLELVGDVVYAYEWERGELYVIDVEDPAAPRELARLPVRGRGTGSHGRPMPLLARIDDRLLLADPFAGLRVFDVADPRRPRPLPPPAALDGLRPGGIVAEGRELFLFSRWVAHHHFAGFETPTLVGRLPPQASGTAGLVAYGDVIVTVGSEGLDVLARPALPYRVHLPIQPVWR